jgi:hypothetical protein
MRGRQVVRRVAKLGDLPAKLVEALGSLVDQSPSRVQLGRRRVAALEPALQPRTLGDCCPCGTHGFA